MLALFFYGLIHAVLTARIPTYCVTCSLSEKNWPNNARTFNGSRWNPASKITPSNVKNLVQAWSINIGSSVAATPAFWNERLFFPAWNGKYYCLDANTGRIIWSRSELGFSRTTPVVGDDLAIFATQKMEGGPRLIALDTKTGVLKWTRILTTHPYGIITQSGTRICNILYVGTSSTEESTPVFGGPCCTFQGQFFAVNTTNGAILWTTNLTIPEYPGVAVWSNSPAIDLSLGHVYITTGDTYDGPAHVKPCMLTKPYSQCVPNTTHGNSIIAIDLYTGVIKWAFRSWEGDWWTAACNLPNSSCPRSPAPHDFDFGQGVLLFKTSSGKKLVGAGCKDGIFYALDAQTGRLAWKTRIGPGGYIGGLLWGSAMDNKRIYVALSNSDYRTFTLPNNDDICYGAFGALNFDCGTLLWMTADPSGVNTTQSVCDDIMENGGILSFTKPIPQGHTPLPMGAVAVANGVVFGTSLNGYIYAFDASNGTLLWSFYVPDGASLSTSPTIMGNSIYFGTGYSLFGHASVRPGTMFYSFKLR